MKISSFPLFFFLQLATITSLAVVSTNCATGSDDEPAPCEGYTTAYNISMASLPHNLATAERLGFDFERDGAVNNELGRGAARLRQFAWEFDASKQLGYRLQHGPWQILVARCRDDDRAQLTFVSGDRASVVPATMTDSQLVNADVNHSVRLPLGWLADVFGVEDSPGWSESVHTSFALTDTGDRLRGRLTVTLDSSDARQTAAYPLAAFVTYAPTGKALRQLLDDDRDGSVTPSELLGASSYVQATAPDIMHAGRGLVSLGIEITATRKID